MSIFFFTMRYVSMLCVNHSHSLSEPADCMVRLQDFHSQLSATLFNALRTLSVSVNR